MILLTQQHQKMIIDQAVKGDPFEICGLIAGIKNRSKKVYPITNIENSPTSFRMSPQEQLNALLDIENNNFDLLAIYHSHPKGPAHPSPTDIEKSYDPNTPNIIISFNEDNWELNAFSITGSQYQRVKLIIDKS